MPNNVPIPYPARYAKRFQKSPRFVITRPVERSQIPVLTIPI